MGTASYIRTGTHTAMKVRWWGAWGAFHDEYLGAGGTRLLRRRRSKPAL